MLPPLTSRILDYFQGLIGYPFILKLKSRIQESQTEDKFIKGYNYLLFDARSNQTESIGSNDVETQLPVIQAIYYLETRLRNPQASREQILDTIKTLSPATFQAYQRWLISTASFQKESEKRGLIICHGRTHSFKTIPDWVPRDATWYTLDISKETDPHFVGDYTDFGTLKKLGLSSWDYVLLQNCPISTSIIAVQNAIRAARYLLKPGGELFYPKGLTAAFLMYDLDNLGLPYKGRSISEFIEWYHSGKIPQVDQIYERIKEDEFYSDYVPFGRRNLKMIA